MLLNLPWAACLFRAGEWEKTNLSPRGLSSMVPLCSTVTGGVMLTFLVRTPTVFLAASNAFTDEPLQTHDGPLATETVESLTLKDSGGKCAFEWK